MILNSKPSRVMTTMAIVLITVLALASRAVGGTFTVTGTFTAWTSFDTDPTHMASYSAYPKLHARNVIGNFDTPQNLFGSGWRFDPPAGTAVHAIKLNAYLTGGVSWSSKV